MSKDALSTPAAPGSREPAAADPLQLAQALYARGRWTEAEPVCRTVLQQRPEHPGALTLLGIILAQTGRSAEAADCLGRAAQRMAGNPEAHNNHGNALRALGHHQDALSCYERALALKPDFAEAHYNRGVTLYGLRQYSQAVRSYDQALVLEPHYAQAWNNRGTALRDLQRLEEALESYERAIAVKPDHAGAHSNRGATLYRLERYDEALACFDRAIAIAPKHAEAHANRGATLTALERYDEAMACFDRAIALDSGCVDAHFNRAVTLTRLKRFPEALAGVDRTLSLGRRDAATYRCRGDVLLALERIEETIESYAQALTLDPQSPFLNGECRHVRMRICDWSDLERDSSVMAAAIERGEAAVPPFVLLALLDSPILQRQAAEIYVREKVRPPTALPPLPRRRRDGKIRLGYFSTDFRMHAVSLLTAGLFEAHDRSRFELTAFSLGPDTPDTMRTRLEAAFDRFVPADRMADRDIAALARRLHIDIAVDLGGHTRDCRSGILALRAAPIQVSYLGYLGTMGGELIDYLIADQVLVPPQSRQYYSEKIAYLPSYQVNDSKRPLPGPALTRAELGLPAEGFVFCCFNNSYKITPGTFDSWMRILSALPDSVLFLLGGAASIERNLRREAQIRQVAPERLVFGRSLPLEQYLARFRAADLFLDTLPYNAGTTASDALWAGLPVLTLPGQALAARMAASILTAAGLPELIAADRADYERQAIELAIDPRRLDELKQRLAHNRRRCALFDTAAFSRSIEALFVRMYERYHAGLPPEHLSPPPSGALT
jgi:predicted O-linked N-acetylglucosamine transferase (SPINDLY family)